MQLSHTLISGLLLGIVASILASEPRIIYSAVVMGFVLYAIVDRFVHPICAFCKRHKSLAYWPLLVMTLALSAHSLVDGALISSSDSVRWGVFLHRVPETLAIIYLLNSVSPARTHTVFAFLAIQVAGLIGYRYAGSIPFPQEAAHFAAGSLAYLAFHGLHKTYESAPSRLWISAASAVAVFALTH